ncbi:uncharacterized protein LOC123561024 isoform X2 [Mercenaria mercenaria]|uniref:uncharacterized protein LOC123561024 isoform X2 n=1 Tax=Mercenaria mercenaria TaxID=6596 RepID=UPI00234E6953|nr:uncharacterized protein LOC123561024 isoform X2 [Mercenaria mercenaria]
MCLAGDTFFLNCCLTASNKEAACNTRDKDGTGVELLGTHYDCKYLRDFYPEDRHIGIYESRKYHCRMPHTDCCQTCNRILSCEDAPSNGIYLAERYFNCSFLLKYHPGDEHVGIYKDRRSICKQTMTDCCASCEKVAQESEKSSTTAGLSSASTTTRTTTSVQSSSEKTTPAQYKDTCENNCLWIADGATGRCSWLFDESRSTYKIRHTLCNGFASGCERTCHIISEESKSTRQPGSTETTTARAVCEDTFMMVEKYSYACSDLLNPSSNIYNNRQALCSSDRSSCCVTCEQVNNSEKSSTTTATSVQSTIEKPTPAQYKEACNTGDKDGTGVELLGTHYDCKYLRDFYPEDRHIGIYESRNYHCRMPLTDCCQTCNRILSCEDAPSNGIYLAERYFNCSFLLKYNPDDEHVGIYKDRRSICKQTMTDCCASCEKVAQESEKSSTTVGLSSASTTTTTSVQSSSEKTTPAQYKDTCENNCLWIADGATGRCSWLLDESRSTYKIRHTLCNGFASGCERTCHIISEESKSTRQPGSTETTTARAVCEDTFMMVEKYSYACSDLLNPNSNMYNNRQALCSSDRSSCCVTCEQVNNVKPSGVIKYTDQNMIDKGGNVIENMPSVANANGYQSDSSGPTDGVKLNINAQTKHPTPQPGVQNKFL